MSFEATASVTARPQSVLDNAGRYSAICALLGASLMILGALLWITSGTDLDGALAAGTMGEYLEGAAAQRALIVANITSWILGVLVLGVAGTAMVRLCTRRRTLAQTAMLCYWTAVPLAIASFVAWLALVVQLAASADASSVTVAETVGWFASRADWIATVLIVGVGPALISIAGRDEWVPTWLTRWGLLAAAAGLLSVIAMFTDGLTSYGFLIVPVGLGWTIAAGIVLIRRTPEPRPAH